jgi:DNA-binding response OmpR family regulator
METPEAQICGKESVKTSKVSSTIRRHGLTILYMNLAMVWGKKEIVDRILIIDDDVELCSLVGEYLASEGFETESQHDGERGLARAARGDYVLIVLDVMLPGINGFEVLRRLRATSRIPVLLLTARGEDVDRIVGLEIGADDYLPKPFNPRELVARIRAILRRTKEGKPSVPPVPEVLRVGNLELDPATRIIRHFGKPVEFTSVEFNLLEALLRDAGRVVTRERLATLVLSRKFSPFDRSIDMHVSKVRKKLGDTDGGTEYIKTVRGVGYIFALPREVEASKP